MTHRFLYLFLVHKAIQSPYFKVRREFEALINRMFCIAWLSAYSWKSSTQVRQNTANSSPPGKFEGHSDVVLSLISRKIDRSPIVWLDVFADSLFIDAVSTFAMMKSLQSLSSLRCCSIINSRSSSPLFVFVNQLSFSSTAG